MRIIDVANLYGTEREVKCPNGGFTSMRILNESHGMGFGLTMTHIPVNGKQHWHYKNHLEACFCIEGKGQITDLSTGQQWDITPGITYVLDDHDDHTFEAFEDIVLVCVFNPPLKGHEIHNSEGVYDV